MPFLKPHFAPRKTRIFLHDGRETAKKPVTISHEAASAIVSRLCADLRTAQPDIRLCFCGSYRRGHAEVHDLDLVLLDPQDRVKSLLRSQGDVLEDGPSKLTLWLVPEGVQLDVRFAKPESWGSHLQYLTGSWEHNVSLRAMAKQRGWHLSEHGLFDKEGFRIAGDTEKSVYHALGLRWLPPNFREGPIHASTVRRV